MPLLEVLRLSEGFTEYRVTSDGSAYRVAAVAAVIAYCIVSLLKSQPGQRGSGFALFNV